MDDSVLRGSAAERGVAGEPVPRPIDTTDFAGGRYLLTLEVFNAAGQRLRPTGASGPGTDAAFLFHMWRKPAGGTDTFPTVPFGGLTHMLWWDNRTRVLETSRASK